MAGQHCGTGGSKQVLRIAIVGVCGSGKTTLAVALRDRGFHARQISQEHSGVTRLWKRFWAPDLLIYLEASDVAARERLGRLGNGELLRRQRERLRVARRECDIYVDTSELSPSQVLEAVLRQLP